MVIKSIRWSKFLEPVHAVVSAIEVSVYAFDSERLRGYGIQGNVPGI